MSNKTRLIALAPTLKAAYLAQREEIIAKDAEIVRLREVLRSLVGDLETDCVPCSPNTMASIRNARAALNQGE